MIYAPLPAPRPNLRSRPIAPFKAAGYSSTMDSRCSSPADRDNVYARLHQDGSGRPHHTSPALKRAKPVRVSEDFLHRGPQSQPASRFRWCVPTRRLPCQPHGRGNRCRQGSPATTGLNGVALGYSVNGGPETTVDLLQQKGRKQIDGSTMLSLEAFKLVPGDLISVYATAKDANAEAHTDNDVHPGRAVRARVFIIRYNRVAVAGAGAKAINPGRSRSARRRSYPPPSNNRETRIRPNGRP